MLKPFNDVETITTLVGTHIGFNSFKNEITNRLHIMYIDLNVCKQMTDVKLL